MKKRLLIFLFFITAICQSQSGGGSVYEFLNIPTSARQLALGGNVYSIEGDINMLLFNPASLDKQMRNKVAANYTSYLAGISMGSVVYATAIKDGSFMIYGGVNYLDYGTSPRTDESGNIHGEFKIYDMAITMGSAYRIDALNLSVGANLKLINSLIDTYSSLGIAADLSLMYKNPESLLVISMVCRNIGTQIKTYDGTREKIPFHLALGLSRQLEHVPVKWYVTLDNLQKWNISASNPSNATYDGSEERIDEKISFLNNAIRHAIFGAELFPDKKFSFRVGYNFRRAKELSIVNKRTFAGFSYGFGLRLKSLQFNYSRTKFGVNTNTDTFSLLIDLDS